MAELVPVCGSVDPCVWVLHFYTRKWRAAEPLSDDVNAPSALAGQNLTSLTYVGTVY